MMPYNLDENHNDIVQALQWMGGSKIIDNARVKRDEKGQLDLWWGLPNPHGGPGIWIWVEVKTESGNLTEKQEENINDCESLRLPVEVIRNTADVERVYKKYLKLMTK
ncbi:MAG: hypothetical protein GY796_36480 [Chloroflexi bacterium]|nr:hypothetical protein [Chloroflexota bacterium]